MTAPFYLESMIEDFSIYFITFIEAHHLSLNIPLLFNMNKTPAQNKKV